MQYSHRILIVEDQFEVARLLNSALMTLERNLGLVNIPSGEEAILDAMKNQVDLMVIDYRLPGINGLELLRKVRRFKPALKSIMITGLSDPKIWEQMEKEHPTALFKKPVPIPDFLDAVIQALEPVIGSNLSAGELHTIDDDQELKSLFHDLKNKFNAQAVIMFNDQGRIHAIICDLDEALDESSLISQILPILASVRNLSRMNGNDDYSSWHIFSRGENDLIFSTLDSSHALLLTGVKKSSDQMIVKKIQKYLKSHHSSHGQALSSEDSLLTHVDETLADQEIPGGGEPAFDIEPIVEKLEEKVPTDELNAFWDEALDTFSDLPSHQNGLSYQQAQELGLTPGDEQG